MKVYFETLGCPKNTNDTQVAKGILLKNGFELADTPEDADAIIVNTCGFINDAKTESINKIFELANYKNPDDLKPKGRKLLASGCLAYRYNDELFEEMPEVDGFLGVNDYERLPDILNKLFQKPEERIKIRNKAYDCTLPVLDRVLPDNPYTQTIKIAEGCNNSCAYCIIPQIRGGFRSKKMEDVTYEAETLANAGCKELVLIAQDVTNYGADIYGKLALPDLLRKLVKIEGIQWIRLMYCYEDRITDELIQVMATEPKICHYIDIPIQHISNNVLKAMKRRSTGDSIRNTIAKLRKAIPDIHIRTTLIVGFPGETEEDFLELADFVEDEKFARLGTFAYSQEEGTVAGSMENQIDEDVKNERKDSIMMRQMEISLEYNKEKIGKTLEVIVDDIDEDGSYVGRTRYDAPEIDNAVIFTSEKPLKVGEIVNVKITDAFDYDLAGVLA